ncbi:MAG TPA: hypothetical protein PKZ91_08050, partial [Saprospiraceae bacterium]|nr:hypothetical protein [Saprospiraceae bacterium]
DENGLEQNTTPLRQNEKSVIVFISSHMSLGKKVATYGAWNHQIYINYKHLTPKDARTHINSYFFLDIDYSK